MKGWLWMLRRFGFRWTLRYWHARRAGMMIDYGKALTADERAQLGEHFTMPWERDYRG